MQSNKERTLACVGRKHKKHEKDVILTHCKARNDLQEIHVEQAVCLKTR